MMFTSNIIILFFVIFMCNSICKTHAIKSEEQETMSEIMAESPLSYSNPSLNARYPIINEAINFEVPNFPSHRRSESAEKYFGWAGKTQRPVEYLRGKRFWLFAKKDEGDLSAELVPPVHSHQSSLTQGLWRSGIVGRRRRRR